MQVVIIGDSLSTGRGTSPGDAWPNLINNNHQFSDVGPELVNAAQNGSGYVSVGEHGATFGSQVAAAVTAQTQVVVFFGSENDMGFAAADVRRAAADAFASARAKAPQAALVVVGPPSYSDFPEPERLEVRDQDQAAALQAGAQFVDPIADRWIMDHADELIGPDGDHPSGPGQRYLQTKMEQLLRPLIR
ncbi:SGNH/GDSL hydrolase family protein [Pseudarthrobacter albicanus]|uniref:SGNH/GDSL hydrolase family protein n=1 Tax=Pseudarthrobacter albicanus TaxID=2823873 RepID=UPI001BA576C3|nr:SGNH/GDSL hydrolase family protein [Pseudarthrobacter albicanus]